MFSPRFLLIFLLTAGMALRISAQTAPALNLTDNVIALDAFGRALPSQAATGSQKKNKTVGIFYFLWEEMQKDGAVYDITRLRAANAAQPQWGPHLAFHWWEMPRFGYYQLTDEWVLRRHATLLFDAGVDVVFCDVTNAFTYDSNLIALLTVWSAMRKEGNPTPQVAFIAWAHPAPTVEHLLTTVYRDTRWRNLWFRWEKKPLLLAPRADLSPAALSFFTIRESWAWSDKNGWFGDGKDKWPWLDNTPQAYGWHDAPDIPEAMPVAVAQHPTSSIGRSHRGTRQPEISDSAQGWYFGRTGATSDCRLALACLCHRLERVDCATISTRRGCDAGHFCRQADCQRGIILRGRVFGGIFAGHRAYGGCL